MADRVTQIEAEVVVQPDTQQARATQFAAEVTVQSDAQKVRVTQFVVEVAVAAPRRQQFLAVWII